MTAAKDEAVANAAKRQVLAPPPKAAITGYVPLIHSLTMKHQMYYMSVWV
jgi:hypothetical protein